MFGVGVSLSDEFAVGFSWGLVKAKLFCLFFFFLIFNFFNEIKLKKKKTKPKKKKQILSVSAFTCSTPINKKINLHFVDFTCLSFIGIFFFFKPIYYG